MYLSVCYYIFIIRGIAFRKEFSKLGDLRGFFPTLLNIMALTATASTSTRKEVIELLGMQKPVIISKSPDKSLCC